MMIYRDLTGVPMWDFPQFLWSVPTFVKGIRYRTVYNLHIVAVRRRLEREWEIETQEQLAVMNADTEQRPVVRV